MSVTRHRDQHQQHQQHDDQAAAQFAGEGQALADQNAGKNMGRRPHRSRRDIDEEEKQLAHVEHADDARHDGFDARHEAADGDALAAMQADEILALGHQLRIAVERPERLQPFAEQAPGPIGDLVADDGAEGGGDEHRPEAQVPGAHQNAGADENGGRGHKQANDEQASPMAMRKMMAMAHSGLAEK